MNERDAVWTISHDIIEMFSKDFGPFKGMALRIAYDNINSKPDKDIKAILKVILETLNSIDEPDAKKK